jgi:hypothetical protein
MTEEKRPDYTSLAPRFSFADTLQEQDAQLEENPLVETTNEQTRR